MKKVQILDRNDVGRDFVVGDMHGMIELFNAFLKHVGFDTSKDRMFSVGDLCDRGTDSRACLDLLGNPWFFCVQGNHEQMLGEFIAGQSMLTLMNGGSWVCDLTDIEVKVLAARATFLPDVIVVRDCFNVIHADFYHEKKQITQQDFLDINSGTCPDGENHLWGRNYYYDLYGQSLTSVSNLAKIKRIIARDPGFADDVLPTYCGHTPVRNPIQIHKLINLDTGAYMVGKKTWAGLTFAEPATGKFWTVKDDVYETTAEVL